MLAAAAGGDLWAAKAAALHHFRNGDFEPALALMQSVVEREANPENVKNVAVALRSVGRIQEAVEWMESRERRVRSDRISRRALLAPGAARQDSRGGRPWQSGARPQGRRPRPGPICPIPSSGHSTSAGASRNLIAFSVWGDNIRYLNGAITNAIVARYLYPGWSHASMPTRARRQAFRDALVQNGAQVVMVEDLPADRFGLFWRFLVEDDPDVDIYLVRDADSVMNIRERWAVADWLSSGKAFHVMRDHPQHSELILAGMWGAHRGNIGGMRERIEACVRAGSNVGNNATLDQHFLRNVVWPIARNSVKIHDDYFDFMAPTRFSTDFPLPGAMHVGQDDWVNFRRN